MTNVVLVGRYTVTATQMNDFDLMYVVRAESTSIMTPHLPTTGDDTAMGRLKTTAWAEGLSCPEVLAQTIAFLLFLFSTGTATSRLCPVCPGVIDRPAQWLGIMIKC